jgi:hypothetical protein
MLFQVDYIVICGLGRPGAAAWPRSRRSPTLSPVPCPLSPVATGHWPLRRRSGGGGEGAWARLSVRPARPSARWDNSCSSAARAAPAGTVSAPNSAVCRPADGCGPHTACRSPEGFCDRSSGSGLTIPQPAGEPFGTDVRHLPPVRFSWMGHLKPKMEPRERLAGISGRYIWTSALDIAQRIRPAQPLGDLVRVRLGALTPDPRDRLVSVELLDRGGVPPRVVRSRMTSSRAAICWSVRCGGEAGDGRISLSSPG